MHGHAFVYVCMYTCTIFYKQTFEKMTFTNRTCGNRQRLFYPNQIIRVSFDFASNIQIYKHQNESLEEVRTTVVHIHTCASKVLLNRFNDNQDNNWVRFWVACFYNQMYIYWGSWRKLVLTLWSKWASFWLAWSMHDRGCLGELSFRELLPIYSEFLVTCLQIGAC